ncbi:hypothetical protein [Dysgonomonas sp. HGC4]|uniref:hypothetical protein n=1 Tax=Dysgonomonas sp. HGC4 TaxID=1658009 RepID=UPI00067F99B6|nr:hypothetical protein [Dysgonomonas sp. HGC4]MBD8349515.1 hypothetical protein [Dysgonomonas sp. HGC4]
MKKQYFSTRRPKLYALTYLIIGLFILGCLIAVLVALLLLFSLTLFLNILDEFIVLFIVIVIVAIVYISRSISYYRREHMVVAEVDENGLYYLTRLNNIKYTYFVEIKEIYLNVDKKIKVLYKNGKNLSISLEISDDEKMEFISLVKKNLIKKGVK